MIKREWLLFTLCVIRSSLAEVENPTIVNLPEGQIRGHTLKSPKGNVYYAFQEIPYAAPPVGSLRFQAPVPPVKWDGVLNTTKNEKICYQSFDYNLSPELIQTEDCLYLNIYTPLKSGNSSETPLPVLIWIHGGAFVTGAGVIQMYNPRLFIDYSLVIVTINYRLGTLGFLTTEDGVIPGNIALKDQHFAIQWVKRNIHLFGGDPERITISGESSGGASVGLQLISPRNKGLFRGAILQSGTAISQYAHQKYARSYAFQLGRSLDENFTSDDSAELLKFLQSLPADVINNNSITSEVGKETELIHNDSLVWLPVIENPSLDGAFLTGILHEDVRTGNINQVPILIGFNSEEALLFLSSDPSNPVERAKFFDNDSANLIGTKFNMTKENKLIAGSKLKKIYTNSTFQDELGSIVKFVTDSSFTTPILRHAKLQSNYNDVYLSQFSYKGRLGGLKDAEVAGVRGVGHAEDLAYIWDYQVLDEDYPVDPEDLVTRHRLLTLWSNFVKYLNPTPNDDSALGNITWNKVSPNSLVYLNINNTLKMETNPRQYLQVESVIDEYAIPPLDNY